jgi:hypothetical protein
MPLDDQTLSTLLRLKRYEQPPPAYFEDFLHEFQKRQRLELLRRPAWRIVLDRLEALCSQAFTLTQFSYATASLAVLCVAGALTFNMLQHPGSSVRVSAEILAANAVKVSEPGRQIASESHARSLNTALSPQIYIPDALLNNPIAPGGSGQHPRYVLDTRPVSYEPPFSF